jgi:GDP-L-fucose synthase
MDAISVMPTNLYGPGDNFDLMSSHVAPALMAKAHQAKLDGADHLQVWGTGRALRELLYVDDAADGIVFLTKNYSGEDIVNLGTGEEVTIAELADTICRVVGFKGEVRYDSSKPDGTPRKVVDVSRLTALGWRAQVSLEDGLRRTYRWYTEHQAPGEMRAMAHA